MEGEGSKGGRGGGGGEVGGWEGGVLVGGCHQLCRVSPPQKAFMCLAAPVTAAPRWEKDDKFQ